MKKIEKLLKDFAQGKICVVFDDENRENEADLIVAIEKLTPAKVNYIITHAKGLLCASLSWEIAEEKGFPLMPISNTDPHSTAFTLSVDSRNVKTGISPFERCMTAMDLIDPKKTIRDFITPGHMFPLIARKGQIIERRGHTEAAVTMCKLSGLKQAALVCEIINKKGKMSTKAEAKRFAEKNNLPYCDIKDLVEYHNRKINNVKRVAQAKLKSEYGTFDITIYQELFLECKEHVFISMGDFTSGVVRVHSECFTGDVLASLTCDCGSQLHLSLLRIAKEGKGAIVYLRQEGRDIGLSEKIKAYYLQQNNGLDTIEANLLLGHKSDNRNFHQAAWILKDQGYKKVHLLTNNPVKAEYLKNHGFDVKIENIPVCVSPENYKYLYTKKVKMGHSINLK
jgi:3,4-dihydroxy 2-butanone 4-phosphate synthase/GTP cyclohydrolase II